MFVALHPREGLEKVTRVALIECNLVHSLRFLLHDGVVWFYVSVHGLSIVPSKVDSTRLFDRLLPSLGEQDGRSVELVGDDLCLVNQDRLGCLELLDQLCGRFSSREDVGLLGDGETVDEGLRKLHANLLNEIEQRLFDPLVVDIDSSQELRDDIDPNLEVNLLEALPQFLLDFRQVSVLEPYLEQAQRSLQRLCLGRGRDLRAEEELLNEAGCGADYMRNILLSELLLHCVIDA